MTAEPIGSGSWARATLWLVSANVLRNLGLLAVLVALAQFTDDEVVGRYALALALTSPVFVFAQLGLKGVYLTLRGRHRFSSFLIIQAGAVILALLVSVAIALAIHVELVSTVALVCLVKAVDCGFELGSGALQRYGRTDLVFWSYLASAVLGVAVVVAVLAASTDLDLALAGLALVNGVIAMTTTLRRGRALAARHEAGAEGLRRHGEIALILRAGLPTGVAAAALALVSSLPQYFLAAARNESAVGYFAVLLYLVAIADIFGGTLTQAWIPSARARLEARQEGFVRYVLVRAARWTAVFVPLVAIGLWLASVLVPVAMSPTYVIGADLAVPLAVAILLLPLLHFGGTAMAVLNLYTHNITLSVVAAAASLVACVALVPTFGLAGALWATVCAYFARGVAALLILVKRAGRDAPTATLRQ